MTDSDSASTDSPGFRALKTLFQDIRPVVATIVVVGAIGLVSQVLHNDVTVRAWVAVAIGAGILILLLILDLLRHREQQARIHTGERDEARRSEAQAKEESSLSPAAEELLRGIDALATTLERRAESLGGMTTGIDAEPDEIQRFLRIIRRVFQTYAPHQSLVDSIKACQTGHGGGGGPPSVAKLLSGLSELRAEVESRGTGDDTQQAAAGNAVGYTVVE